jgi:EpsI family protein
MIIVAGLSLRASAGESSQPRLGALPVTLDAWQGPLPATSDWAPTFNGVADQARAAYRSADGTVEVYVNVYGRQTPGLELVQYENSLGTKDGWEMMGDEPAHAHATADGDALAYEVAQTGDKERWLLAHEYIVGARATRSGAIAQLSYGATALTGPRPAGVVAFASRCDVDCDVAHALIASFWRAHGPAVRSLIPRMLPGDRNVWPHTPPDTRDVEH